MDINVCWIYKMVRHKSNLKVILCYFVLSVATVQVLRTYKGLFTYDIDTTWMDLFLKLGGSFIENEEKNVI